MCMGKIISVVSGKGGQGKTFVSVNLSCALKKLEFKTLLIDMSFGVRNSDIYLNATSYGVYNIYDIVSKTSLYEDSIITFDDELKPDFVAPSVREIDFDYEDAFKDFILSVKDMYDYIVIDTPYGASKEFSISTKYSDIVLFCVTDEYLSLENSSLCLTRIENANQKDKYIVINKFIQTNDKDDKCVEDYADEMSVPIIGIISYDDDINKSMKNSEIFHYKSDDEFLNIAKRLCSIYPDATKHSFINNLFGKRK